MNSRQIAAALLLVAIAPIAVTQTGLEAAHAAAMNWSKPWIEPHDAGMAAAHSDEYAWRLFVALNWPADVSKRAADPTAAFGADRPVVWEVWQNASDVYLDDGSDPGPWNAKPPAARERLHPTSGPSSWRTSASGRGPSSGPTSPAGREPSSAATPPSTAWPASASHASPVAEESRFETFSLKDIPVARHIVGGKMVPLTDPAASAKRLTEIRMNRAAFEYIRANELYNLDGQLRLIASGRTVSFPSAAIEIKAKWRPIRDDERARYHTLTVRFADGTQRLYGLTALHIVSKALPQWFWATFEHVDNPTLPGSEGWQLPSRDRFACTTADASDDDAVVGDNAVARAASNAGASNRAPGGIGLEGTVWQNYRLRGTLTRFVDDGNRPLLLANSELEAGMQQTSSCITCHARSSLGLVAGTPMRLPIFNTSAQASALADGTTTLSAPTSSTPAPGTSAPGALTPSPSESSAATMNPSASIPTSGGAPERRGYVGVPRAEWFEDPSSSGKRLFEQLDFVWSLSKARPRKVPHET